MYKQYAGGATPSGADAHMDVPLSNITVQAFSTGESEFIADQLFPGVPVDKQTNKYYVIEKGRFLALPPEDALRSPKTKARRVEFTVSSDSFFAHNYALANEIPLEDLSNADRAINLRENSALLVVSQLKRARENRVASLVTSASNVGSGAILSGTTKWSDYINSDPLGDVTTAHAFIRAQTGLVANTAVVDWDTFQVLQRHPDILELYRYTSGGMATRDQIRDVLKVQKLLIGQGVKNVGKQGQVASMSNIWGNNCLICYTSPAAGLQTQTLGLFMNWTPPELPYDMQVFRSVINQAGSEKVEIVEVGHFQDTKVVAPDLGYLIGSTL